MKEYSAHLDTFAREPGFSLRVTNRVIAGLDADSLDFVATTDSAVIEKQSSAQRFVRADCNEVGYRLRANPLHDVDEIPRVPKARYAVMRRFLPPRGELALHMMHLTATV